ncbi:MAG: SAM hydrolase/SAM-dependent halogenase family protein [Flavobacteriales bacterium]|jgi:S-adenosylmethionine hydrolase|nr:SAM-dependent chlorinase/fluorinase [Schleiferiaceae bacterium]|tara:strand:- start:16215 stop:17021 length:807 start_codon:yes stop_codon:yes gene_type:complete
MPIVSLTTDYGWKDPDAAAIRAGLYSEMLRHQVASPLVDVSHDVSPRSHQEAAYILGGAYKAFPKGSVHLMLIDCRPMVNHPPIAAMIDGHYFLTQDHGGLSLLFPGRQPDELVTIDMRNRLDLTDPGDIMTAAAAHLIAGGTISTLGPPRPQWNQLQSTHPEVLDPNHAIVHVQYVDHFGQVVTNASETWLKEWQQGRTLKVLARGMVIDRFINNLGEKMDPGSRYMRINDMGFLELGISWPGQHGVNTASNLFGLGLQDPVELQLH